MSKLIRLSDHTKSKIVHTVVVGTGVAVSLGHFFCHSIFIEKYAHLFQFYEKGFEVEVPKKFETWLSQISDDLVIPVRNPVTKLFGVIGFDLMRFGSTLMNTGAYIGVPKCFFYENEKDIDHDSIQIYCKPVSWGSVDGENLEKSLIMSDSAKKFGIAYELAVANTPIVYFHIACGPTAVLIFSQINNYFYNVMGLPYRSFVVKSTFYFLLTLFGFGVYCALKDIATQKCEYDALEKVCEGGKEYITGGIEYFEKLLLRNNTLRNLQPDGKSDYKSTGDPIFLFRQRHVPPTVLKSLLEYKLESNNENLPGETIQFVA